MLTPAMAQEVWKSPERPSIEKRPGRCANTVSIPGLDLLLTDTSNIDPDIIAAVAISGGRIVHIEPLRVEIERIEQACLAAT